MTVIHILTDQEAANFVRTTTTDSIMLMLLPMVDEYIQHATGRDWTQDITINNRAKAAAGQILIAWYDDSTLIGTGPASAIEILTQLEAEALKYRKYIFRGANGSGGIALEGARVGDAVIKLRGYYGVSGDQSASFEAVISYCDQITQTNSGDLSTNRYVVILKSPADDIGA